MATRHAKAQRKRQSTKMLNKLSSSKGSLANQIKARNKKMRKALNKI